MELQRPFVITAMAKHEKFFPVAVSSERLTNKCISITNGGDEATVRGVNEWVLIARFNDAKFFYDEDIRHDLAHFLEKTGRILFQDKLGTIRQRADRIAKIARGIGTDAGFSEQEIDGCEKAGLLCKADLSTGLVSELPSLQGKIGGESRGADEDSSAHVPGTRDRRRRRGFHKDTASLAKERATERNRPSVQARAVRRQVATISWSSGPGTPPGSGGA